MSGAPTRGAMLALDGLLVEYGSTVAVDRVSVELASGITALLGPSGCGKTSILRAIAGFEEPAAGRVVLGDRVVAGPGVWVPAEERQVGMVFQEGALFPHLTVEGNVGYGVSGRRGAARRVGEVLDLVGMADFRSRYPDQLSGGQRQRVALARALAPAPRLVLLDEPFASLDAALRDRVRGEVRAILDAAGTSAILVTHDQEEALSFADRVAVMSHGRVLQVGSPEAVYRRPATVEVARFFGAGQLVPCTVAARRFESALGSAVCESGDGGGLVWVRPEDLELRGVGSGSGLAGVVTGRRYYGHDVLDQVRVESGETLEVRVLSRGCRAVGDRVWVVLREGSYAVFPPDAAGIAGAGGE